MHLYAFGSICRGEIAFGSDVDLLAIVEGVDGRLDPRKFSIYAYDRMRVLWREGNPFAWHLALESRLIHAGDGSEFLAGLGRPEAYTHCVADCERFKRIFVDAAEAVRANQTSLVFDLSSIFLAIRNVATCFSLATGDPIFSRNSALQLGINSLPLDPASYSVFEQARLLSVRGRGERPSEHAVKTAVADLNIVETWMDSLLEEATRV